MTTLLTLLTTHDIPTYELSSPKEVHAVDGKLLERVTHKTEPLKLVLSSNLQHM